MKKLYELIRVSVSFDGLNPTPVALLCLLSNWLEASVWFPGAAV